MQNFEQELQELLEYDENQLYEMISKAIINPELNFKSGKNNSFFKYGKEWFKINRNEIQSIICKSDMLDLYLKSDSTKNRVVICSTICDLLLGYLSLVPVTAVSVLIFNEGLDSFCKRDIESDKK